MRTTPAGNLRWKEVTGNKMEGRTLTSLQEFSTSEIVTVLKLSLLQKDSMRISKPSSVHLSDSFCIILERILLWMIKSIASLNPTLLLIHVNKTEACFSLCECPDRGTEGGKVLHDCWGHKPLFLLYPPAVHSQSHVTAQDGCFSCHHHHLNSN